MVRFNKAAAPIGGFAVFYCQESIVPEWIIKLARRLMALPAGRYQIILTIGNAANSYDWTVISLGKIENS